MILTPHDLAQENEAREGIHSPRRRHSTWRALRLVAGLAAAIVLGWPWALQAGPDPSDPVRTEPDTAESRGLAERPAGPAEEGAEEEFEGGNQNGGEQEEGEQEKGEQPVSAERLREAVARAIGPMESSAAEYRNQRQCFSCHHQAVPVLALHSAHKLGFQIDEENLRQQVEHTRAHLERGREDYLEGKGQGGRADTAGWALWTLEAAGHPPDDTTTPVADYLLDWQREMGHWSPPSRRPPTEASPFTTTYVALRGIHYFVSDQRQTDRDARIAAAKSWLHEAAPADTEDHVFQLRSLHYLREDPERIAAARESLLSLQRDDGGWAQTREMTSDVYATATALAALHEAGGEVVTSPAYQRGLRFLLDAQLPDGSWHVATRSKPIQVYFESGFPHGKDQFISMAASSWSVLALLAALPPEED